MDEDKLPLKVANYLAHGTWDLHKLKEDLPLDIGGANEGLEGGLYHFVPAGLCCKHDSPIWKHTSNGSFSVKSAYRANCKDFSNIDVSWAFIWTLKAPPKIKYTKIGY
ncbi:unnamed protein product [Prunus brigantina]